jgi:hypothetical protein
MNMKTRRIQITDLQAQAELAGSIGDTFNLHSETTGDGWKDEQRRAKLEADRAQAAFLQSHFSICHVRD